MLAAATGCTSICIYGTCHTSLSAGTHTAALVYVVASTALGYTPATLHCQVWTTAGAIGGSDGAGVTLDMAGSASAGTTIGYSGIQRT